MADVSIPAAFGAGLVSFVSPCVLPLAAPYLCYLAGASVEALASEGAAKAIKCSITELIALTRRAKLFVGGDTGPMHLAAALRVPAVAIFGPTDPTRNGPYGTRSIVLRSPASPTTHARRARPDEGLMEIGVNAVVDAARSLLAQGGQECPPHTEGGHG